MHLKNKNNVLVTWRSLKLFQYHKVNKSYTSWKLCHLIIWL